MEEAAPRLPTPLEETLNSAAFEDSERAGPPGPRVMLTLFGNEALLGERRLRPLNR